MKKTIFTIFASLFLVVAGSGQTILTNTTLSTAVTAIGQQTIVVASASGISAPTPNTGNVYGVATSEAQSYLYVDRELMQVKGVSGTNITVIRGVGGTASSLHAASAFVFVVPAAFIYGGGLGSGLQSPAAPAGACTRGNEMYLPRIDFANGVISDCLGGQWVQGDAQQTQRLTGTINDPPTAGTAYTSLETNGTAFDAATSMYCNEIKLPYSKVLTGLKVLMGTIAGGTEKKAVLLYDAGGNLLANSATAGQTMGSTGSVYVSVPFTTPFYAVGPTRYFGCIQSNGTSDTIRHTITGVNDNYLNAKVTGQTFGTFAATITAPTTFTTAIGPYFQLY